MEAMTPLASSSHLRLVQPSFGQSPGFDQYSAKCTPYVLAQITAFPHGDPSKPVLAFYTSIQSIGLTHYSRALTSAFIKGADQNLRKQQDDEAAKRAVPKL